MTAKLNYFLCKTIATLSIVTLLLACSEIRAAEGRLLADDWPVFDLYYEMELRGYVPLGPNVWPVRSGRVEREVRIGSGDITFDFWANEILTATDRIRIKKDTIGILFEPGITGVAHNPKQSNDKFYPLLRPGGGMKKGIFEGFVSYQVNLKWANDPNYRGRQWEGFAGRPDQVYLRTSEKDWGVQFGKDYISWGEGLVLGDVHDPFEKIDYQIDLGPFDFRGFAGVLDAMKTIESVGDSNIYHWHNRYLSGHRLEFLSKHFSVAIYETIIYGGEGRTMEIGYLVPFYWFHAEQLNKGYDDNTMVGGDFQVLFSPAKLSFELLVDDIQVEAEDQADEEPPEIGVVGQLDYGLSVFDKWLTLRGRYEGVTNRTYNQRYFWNRYTLMNNYLGSRYGNDFERISVGTKLYLSPYFIIDCEFFHQRNGEGDVFDNWTEPWMETEGGYTECFPSGVVEEVTGCELSFEGYFKSLLFWNLSLNYSNIGNFENVEGEKSEFWDAEITLEFPLVYWVGI